MKTLAKITATALALATCLGCSRGDPGAPVDPYADETARREAFIKHSMLEADAGRALGMSSTAEIQYEEGLSLLSYDPPDDFHAHAFRWMGQRAHIRLKTRGRRTMKIVMGGWIHEKVIRTHPVMSLYIDNELMKTSKPIDREHFEIEAIIPDWSMRRPWVDLQIRTSAVGFHWGDPPELRVIVLYKFEWSEFP